MHRTHNHLPHAKAFSNYAGVAEVFACTLIVSAYEKAKKDPDSQPHAELSKCFVLS